MHTEERRRWFREELPKPTLALLHQEVGSATPRNHPNRYFVEVNDLAEGGCSLVTDNRLDKDSEVSLLLMAPDSEQWSPRNGRVVWVCKLEHSSLLQAGIEYRNTTEHDTAWTLDDHSLLPTHEDQDFLLNTDLLQAIPFRYLPPLLNRMTLHTFAPGERIIRQNDKGEELYLLQEGECDVHADKDGLNIQIARLGRGDVVGEMAVFTGEPRTAHVDAATKVKAWRISREDFETLSERHPDLRIFLTELISRRFESSPFTPDRTVGKYAIKRKIGQGGWSIVYLGTHRILNMPVAIKMLRHDLAMEPDFLENFRKEANIIAPMSHPHIVQVFDIEELYKTLFITMEYLEGDSLRDILLRQGRISPEKVVHLIRQMLLGLEYAHNHGVIHRDLKPANIFIQSSGLLKILDFGLACAPGTTDINLTGSVKYAPPEQIDGNPVDERSDIYSLGIVAFEMLTGRRPYPENNLVELLDLHCEQEIPDPGEFHEGLSRDICEFVLRCCKRAPLERFQNAGQALAALAEIDGAESQPAAKRKRLAVLHLLYDDSQRLQVARLMEHFGKQSSKEGFTLKISLLDDI